jgi:murein DD-endopeptidase MepM/ murein hydrolase activator NlpD
MIRSIAAAALALATLGSPAGHSTARAPTLGPAPEPVNYQAPVAAPVRVLRGFDPPADPFGPGHLGVDLAAGRHAVIGAAGSGVVRFAGPVAGRGVVVIEHPDGIRTEYEPVQPQVEVGAAIRAGDPIGRISGQHAGCAPRSCLHWGARRGDTYLDPMSLLGRLGPVRLLPWAPGPRHG